VEFPTLKKILDRACGRAKAILEEHRSQLELVTQKLLENETLDAQTFNRLIGRSFAKDGQGPGPSVAQAPHTGSAGNGHQTRVVAKRLERAGLPALSRRKDARPVKKREQAPALHTLRDKA
jgi:hypothetical protein